MTLVGRVVAGRYRVEAALGTGATASAWRVEDLHWQEKLTLKLAKHGALAELRREFALLTRLRDPRLPRARDLGSLVVDGQHYDFLTTHYVEGQSLRDFSVGASSAQLTDVIADVLRGLDTLHALGLRHGDVKGTNVIVRAHEGTTHAALIDFGMAQRMGAEVRGGTPRFMAPELSTGARADGRADLFALGVALGDCLEHAPSTALSAIRDALCAAKPDARPADARAALALLGREPAPLPTASRLVGRDRSMARIEDAVEACLQGRSDDRVVWVHGRPGSGRSRLLEEAKWRAQTMGRLRVVSRPGGDDAIRSCLREALGRDIGANLVEALDAVEEIRTPSVFIVDDVDALGAPARQIVDALVRTSTRNSTVLWLFASSQPPPANSASVELGPLTVAAVARWAEGRIDASEHRRLHELSGGYPAIVEQLLASASHSAGLEGAAQALSADDRFVRRLRELTAEGHEVLAFIALGGDSDETETLRELEERGWLVSEGSRMRLARPADVTRIVDSLELDVRRVVRRRVADSLLGSEWPDDRARALEQLAELGERAEVEAVLDSEQLSDPAVWLQAVERVTRCFDGMALDIAARLALAANDPERALEHLTRSKPRSVEDCVLRSRALSALGRSSDALAALEAARGFDAPWAEARLLDAEARAHTRSGDRKTAYEIATRALAALHEDAPGDVRARLLEAQGVAASYLGEHEVAKRALTEAASWLDAGPADQIRIATYLGIDAYRRGDVRAAALHYQRALEIAEAHRRPGDIARSALNLGSAHHQAGNLGEACRSYIRGERLARALDQRSIRLTLQLNLGKLHTDAGEFEGAEKRLAQVESESGALQMAFLAAAAASIRAENFVHAKRFDDAWDAYARALEGFTSLGAKRETAEVRLLRCAGYAAAEMGARARQEWSALSSELEQLGALDLRIRHSLLSVRLEESTQPIAVLESALEQARTIGQALLEAEVHAALAAEWDTRGAVELRQRALREMRGLHERATATLPASLRTSFRALHEQPAHHQATSQSASDESQDWRQLVQATALLNEDLSLSRVLARTMDAAIGLTGAERGFVILRNEDGALDVAAARNVDRERVPHGYLKFSRSIAEKAMQTAESIIATDAQSDDRFRDEASVHAMKLRSVLVVPIPSPAGILGALYLDNRFEVRRFGERQRELLMALANQVALAIRNARLVEALEQAQQETQLELEQQLARVDELSDRLSAEAELRFEYGGIVGRSEAMRKVLRVLDKVTDSAISVLVQGESGTGKEVVARTLHDNGPRRERPFVSLNCGALPDSLLESELFGHVKGAFTGAVRDRSGLFVSAEGGTLFLDEIGEMSSAMQVRLLRALQERRVRPVGSSREIDVDVRVVAATNRNLRDEVDKGRFREDLYYRLNVVELELPPLRKRVEDIPLLTQHFLERLSHQHAIEPPTLSSAALRTLVLHDWPGNVRELLNVLERAFVMADGEIQPDDLALPHRRHTKGKRTPRSKRTLERARIREALIKHDWNVAEVSRALAIPRSSLYRKLARYGLRRPKKAG